MLFSRLPDAFRRLPRTEQERIRRAARRRGRRAPVLWMFLGLAVSAYLAMGLASFFTNLPDMLVQWVPIALFAAAIIALSAMADQQFRKDLRAQLIVEGILPPACLECPCEFGSLEVRTCPHCGAAVPERDDVDGL